MFKLLTGMHAVSTDGMRSIVGDYGFVGGAGDYTEELALLDLPPGERVVADEQKEIFVPQPATLNPAELLSAEARAFVAELLDVNFITRLGSGRLGSDNVRGHVFFQGVDWASVEAMAVSPPLHRSMSDKLTNAAKGVGNYISKMFQPRLVPGAGIAWRQTAFSWFFGDRGSSAAADMNIEVLLQHLGKESWVPQSVQKLASMSMGHTFHSQMELNELFKQWDFVSNESILEDTGLNAYL